MPLDTSCSGAEPRRARGSPFRSQDARPVRCRPASNRAERNLIAYRAMRRESLPGARNSHDMNSLALGDPPPRSDVMSKYSLSHLSDHVLLRLFKALDARDRATTAELLAHVAEIDGRKLYAPA